MIALPRTRSTGFTLVEIMVVVVIIGLMTAMALPSFIRVRERAQATALANDLRSFRDSIDSFQTENGFLPEYTADTFPPFLEGWISESQWDKGGPIGVGVWQFENFAPGVDPAFLVYDTPGSANDAVFQLVDEILDDGVRTTGRVLFDSEYIGVQFSVQ